MTRRAMVFKSPGLTASGNTGWWRLGREALSLRLRVEREHGVVVRIWTNDAGVDDGAREPFYQRLEETRGVQRRTISDLDEFIKIEWEMGRAAYLGIKAELISA